MKKSLFRSICISALIFPAMVCNSGPVVLQPFKPDPAKRDSMPFVTAKGVCHDEQSDIMCDVTGRLLTIFSEYDLDQVKILIYGFPAGVKHTSTVNLAAGEIHSIDVNYPSGIYTIRLTLTDGTVLEGAFEIE